ncbi:MAG: NFACT family protein [archaeon]|jgi:predicted ribosome quality control (RQC) complex YloA/Tae2 family protein
MDLSLSNLTLKHLVGELNFLENGFVNNVQTLENNWMKIKIHTKEFGDKQLILTPNALFVSNSSLSAKQNPGGFSALLKKYLNNQRIFSLKQYGVDRIIVFEFAELLMIIELFAKGNIILCDRNMKIIRAMRKEEWKDRKVGAEEEYKFPSSKGTNPIEETEKEFEKKIKENSKSFFGATVDILNASPAILEYLFDELKLDKKKEAKEASSKEIKEIFKKIKETYSSKEGKVYLSENVLYSCETNKVKEKEFDSIQAALNTLQLNEEVKKEIIVNEGPSKDENKKKLKYEKDIQSKLTQIEGLTIQEKESLEKGELVYVKYQEIKEIFSAIEKGKAKKLPEKEIIAKINSIKPLIKELDFKKNKVVLEL